MPNKLLKRASLALVACLSLNFALHNYELNSKQISSYVDGILSDSEICKSNNDIHYQYYKNTNKESKDQFFFKNNFLYYESKFLTSNIKKQEIKTYYNNLKIQFSQNQFHSRSPPIL